MGGLDIAIARIKAGPQGPSVGAFFDFDGTLIDGFSAAEYFKERIRSRAISLKEIVTGVTVSFKDIHTEAEFAELFKELISEWAGNSEEEVREKWAALRRVHFI